MLFRQRPGAAALAISQPSHAWISGQILRAWAESLEEPLLLAAEQHDIAWLDWEAAPSFDPATGRPHLFRALGPALHAPMWARGVERALAAWGRRAALLISRHGSLIYTRYADRRNPADAAAVDRYLETQAPLQAGWARALGLDEAQLARDSALVAFADALSLALCGDLPVPIEVDAPGRAGDPRKLRLAARPGGGPGHETADEMAFTLAPWPFRGEALTVACEARPLPAEGRFAGEAAMRAWLDDPARAVFRARLAPG